MDARTVVYRYRFFVFSGLTLGLAALVFASGMDPQMTPFALVLLPALSALVTAVIGGRGEVGRLARRIVRWRVNPRLYLVAIGVPVLGTLLIVALAVATGTPMSRAFSGFTPAAVAIPLVVLLPAFLEEFGWRGFGIPALGRMPLLASALIVAVPFTLIHLPLHMPGHLYDGLPMWATVLALVSYSVPFAWIFSAGRGSSLLAALMHAAANGAVPLTWGLDPVRVWEMRGVAFVVVAIVFVVLARRSFLAPANDGSSAAAGDVTPEPVAAPA